MQLVVRSEWRRGGRPDWTNWNRAFALIWLVGEREVIATATQMDHVFWQYGDLVRGGETVDADTWRAARDAMETARVEFINAARHSTVRAGGAVDDAPVTARTPLSNVDIHPSSEPDAATSSDGSLG
jgi:hypothetical protein